MALCPECGMHYVAESSEDRRLHRRYHNQRILRFTARPLKTDRIVWQEGNERITVVNFRSHRAQKARANLASSVANSDTHFDFPAHVPSDRPDDSDIHMFLLYQGRFIIGLVVLGKLPQRWECTWQEYREHKCRDIANPPTEWAVNFAWVARSKRRMGFARRLIAEAARYFTITPARLGWTTPLTEPEGEALVRAFCPEGIRIAK